MAGATIPTISARSWQDADKALEALGPGFAFRGQATNRWPLRTTIERNFATDRQAVENDILARFDRHGSRYRPVPTDTLHKLSMLQHYGAPTRLIDFTRSRQVALFFAFEDPPGAHTMDGRVVWAINTTALQMDIARQLGGDPKQAFLRVLSDQISLTDEVMKSTTMGGFLPVEAWWQDHRQAAQQSIQLLQVDLRKDFFESLSSVVSSGTIAARVIVAESCRAHCLAELDSMGTHAESLFAGFDGFARSMRTRAIREREPLILRVLRQHKVQNDWNDSGLAAISDTDLATYLGPS